MAEIATRKTAELFCRAAKRALAAVAARRLNTVMRIRTKLELDENPASRPARLPTPARDIIAALLLTLAAAILIGAAATSRHGPDGTRIEAAAGRQ